ncbi:hypothetical protein [Cyanobium sp. Morenito 9A2]|uniref:hypothetical protein n=1 Tax=Cyanobium sp. Morenito 9A2 TaxID=2823718 RepID=UPI0020CD38B8|nr:hypothetical protein [Cyanobium sp. Morenito 9A2]MCP9850881.1 hypothetical protein [Cyanobium sp. Morenito 9A2]
MTPRRHRRTLMNRHPIGRNPIGRNPWALLTLLLLGLGLAVQVFHGPKGTQRDQRRELRKF